MVKEGVVGKLHVVEEAAKEPVPVEVVAEAVPAEADAQTMVCPPLPRIPSSEAD